MQIIDFKWTALDREKYINQALNKHFDLIIVGGGITGAGIARDAALRGLSFLLLDKDDFAFGTSSRSSKLAHGGLRYLKTYEFGLVRESTTERNWLRCHLPNLVRPLAFNLYSYEGWMYKPKKVKLAMSLYDFLSDTFSKYKNYQRYKLLSKEAFSQLEPKIRKEGLLMGGYYYDTNVDDARLTVESIKDALFHSEGNSVALNYVKVDSFEKNAENKIIGVNVIDILNQKKYTFKGTQVINATGIWADEVLKSERKIIRPTKGVHIIIKNDRLGNHQAFGLQSKIDGRFYFILRREKYTVIGTTDTDYQDDLNNPLCNKDDCDYLFHTVNWLFPDANLNYNDIISTYAGVRPLVMEEGKSESQVSRKHTIIDHSDGLVSLLGGKLTIYRKMGEELILHLIEKGIFPKTRFTKKQLSKGFSQQPFSVGLTRSDFDKQYQSLLQAGSVPKLDEDLLEYLHREYGVQSFEIMKLIKANPALGERFLPENEFIPAEIDWICEHEMAAHVLDVICRRTEMWLFVHHRKVDDFVPKVADVMAKKYQWSADRKAKEIADAVRYLKSWVWF
jgi:glycerol-3-phosphate dehydrogenase